MMTKIIPFVNVYLPAPAGRTESPEVIPRSAGTVKLFDLRCDDLPHSGDDDEFGIDDYLDTKAPEVHEAVDAQGPWVADTLYRGQNTLTTLRLRAGLSQKALAERCGWEQPHISRYESGSTEPGLLAARKLANALDVSLDDLADAMQNSLTKEPA